MKEKAREGIALFEKASSKEGFIQQYIDRFDSSQKLAEESIFRIVEVDQKNTDPAMVYAKVVMINSIWVNVCYQRGREAI